MLLLAWRAVLTGKAPFAVNKRGLYIAVGIACLIYRRSVADLEAHNLLRGLVD